jgi:acetyl-CoA synthetase
MANIGSYEQRLLNFNWSSAEKELEYRSGDVINIGWYCSDRICNKGLGEKIALYFEDYLGIEKKFTFDDVRIASNAFGLFLRNLGLKNADRVCLFMDRIPELYFSFLGILKIGAVVQPLFSAFGDESLYIRLADAQTSAIITQRKHLNKIRKIRDKLPELKFIIIVDNQPGRKLEEREIEYLPDEGKADENKIIYPTMAESPSVLHYTSGTTGQPKGVQHVHYSLMSQYLTAKWVLDLRDDDIYWCTADPGWVTGTSYGIIGPWSLGITQCVYDGGFSAQAWYRFVEKYRVSVWYTSPTAIRSLMKAGENIVKDFDLSCLRQLASVGEPLNPEAVVWSEKVFGRPFHDTFWQTETGSIMVSNFPGMKIKPGSMGKPFPGLNGTILDQEKLIPVNEPGKIGLLAFRPGWPAMMRAYHNHEEKYREKFVNGWYLTGDKASIDNDGYFWFVGRNDDVINTGGHLVSPFEVESILLEHPAVAESAVVAKPDEVNMEVVKAFITLKPGFTAAAELELDIMNFIRRKLSAVAMPQEIEFMDKLPKTRSGKIMRRLLHAKEWGEETGDISTLEND